ncbi:MAG: hypothetical protein GX857_09550 [Bacteroidales bacterium]|nr:hypothetical protein [Bacteroidales bacterium]
MKKSKTVKLVLAMIVSLLFVQCTGNSDKRLHKELVRRAAELNQSTPVALDQYTRFDSVGVSKDNVFQYYYTITNINNPHQLITFQKEEMMQQMDKMYATDRALQFFVNNSVTMEYIYRDTEQNVIEVITIETEKYKSRIQQ